MKFYKKIDHLYSSLSCVIFYLFEYQSLLFSSHPTYVTNDDVKKIDIYQLQYSSSSNNNTSNKNIINKISRGL